MSLLLAKVRSNGEMHEYVGAGHDAWIVADSGESRRLDSTGLVLGVVSDAPVAVSSIPPLNAGDLLLVATDGVAEARSPEGELFGTQRMLDVVAAHRHQKSDEIIQRLMTAVREFAQRDSLADDVTTVIVKAR